MNFFYDPKSVRLSTEKEQVKVSDFKKEELAEIIIELGKEIELKNDAGDRITPEEHIEIMKAGGYL